MRHLLACLLCSIYLMQPTFAQQMDCGQRCGQTIPADGQTCIAGEVWQCSNGQLIMQNGTCDSDPCQTSADHSFSPALMNDLYGNPYDDSIGNPDNGSIRPPTLVQTDDGKKRAKPDDTNFAPSN